ncbi:hypothetical protein ORV05_05040 [Amycolatopsis cynarae]|uniref:DUF3618 domain-containing protein n=1 Tax=Amycolatopsis cynarae TaxID=2995223 RepID=A0ABY7B677_9PSEU|nr:hypothetical protein [Amycolatopsis sp. HUAS 11-8]WAL67158.1 hypothetical protein ORV05_05040 [Amycolatopsis sp. HUAS 11-8]
MSEHDDGTSNTVITLINSWLARIESKLDNLASTKADKSEVDALRKDLNDHGERLNALHRQVDHQTLSEQEKADERRYKLPVKLNLWLIGLTIVLVVATVVLVVKG